MVDILLILWLLGEVMFGFGRNVVRDLYQLFSSVCVELEKVKGVKDVDEFIAELNSVMQYQAKNISYPRVAMASGKGYAVEIVKSFDRFKFILTKEDDWVMISISPEMVALSNIAVNNFGVPHLSGLIFKEML